MTIPNDNRLRFLRDTSANERTTYTSVERVEFVSILDELIGYRAAQQSGGTAPPATEPAIDISAQIDRISQGLVDNHNHLNAAVKGLHERINGVVEIIGTRIDGLDTRLKAIENGDAQDYSYVLKGLDEVRLRSGLGKMEYEHPRGAAPFPTGGASTAEAAADAVLPVPQRGDRVRLEGAYSIGRVRLKDGWYDVVGSAHDFDRNGPHYQVLRSSGEIYWVAYEAPGLKEVRHAGD